MQPFENGKHYRDDHTFLPKITNWQKLLFYRKSVVLYDLTYHFTQRFMRLGDRTIDQMVQAARSGKQNIIEGLTDGTTSMEMQIKLLNVARGSNQELMADYEDYLRTRHLQQWKPGSPEFQKVRDFCYNHHDSSDYEPFYQTATDEQLANMALTLCHSVDSMLGKFVKAKEADFAENGGIRERMTAARLDLRADQKAYIAHMEEQLRSLTAENESLRAELAALRRREI